MCNRCLRGEDRQVCIGRGRPHVVVRCHDTVAKNEACIEDMKVAADKMAAEFLQEVLLGELLAESRVAQFGPLFQALLGVLQIFQT